MFLSMQTAALKTLAVITLFVERSTGMNSPVVKGTLERNGSFYQALNLVTNVEFSSKR